MRYLKKRELAAFYIISKKYCNEQVKINDIIETISYYLASSIKISKKILKRLEKMSLVSIDEKGIARIKCFEQYIDWLVLDYIAKRASRYKKM